MKRRTSFVLSGCLGLSLCGVAWLAGSDLPFQELDAGLGPAFFPTLLIGLLLVTSLGLIAVGLLDRRPDDGAGRQPAPQAARQASRLSRPAGLFAATLAFGVSVGSVHALVTTFLFLLVSMLLLGEDWRRAAIAAAGVTGLIYLLFGAVFGLAIFAF